jgi:hypothetical protein
MHVSGRGFSEVTPTGPLTLWTGWDLRKGVPEGAAKAQPFGHTEGVATDRYELLAVAARGFRPPQFLTVLDLSEQLEGEVHELAAAGANDEVIRQAWSLAYRQVAATEPRKSAPFAIYLLGVDPPPDATDEELEVFNDFYTNVHLPEVAERRHALRAVRYELVRALKPPYQGAPRFLAAYEVDEAGASNRRHVGPPYSSGPEVWQRHKTPWRLWYCQLGPELG